MRRTWPALSLLCALIALPTPAAAQLGDDLGRMWLSFSETELTQSRDVKPGDDFVFYIRTEIDFGNPGQNATDGLLAWEAQVVLPPEVTVTSRTIYGNPINCLNDSCGNDFSLGYAGCIKGDETPVTLVRYDATVTSIPDVLEISLTGNSQSSTGGDPGWLNCVAPQNHRKFASDWDTPLQLQFRVATKESTWSALKADFD